MDQKVFPRTDTSACDAVKSRIASYCNANDTFCDSGSSLEVHLSYVQDNGTSAVDFIVKQVKSGSSSSSSASSNTSMSGGGTTTMTNVAASVTLQKALTSGFGLISLGLGFLFIL